MTTTATKPNPLVNIAERVLWTFVQAFLGSLPATFTLTGNDFRAVLYSGLTAGLAAVVSIAKNLTLTPGA
jgi:hypothetical protein